MQARMRSHCRHLAGTTVLIAAVVLGLQSAHAADPATVKGTVSMRGDSAAVQDVIISIDVPAASPAAPSEHRSINQKDMTFIPHVLPVLIGTTVEFLNSDNAYHNVFSNSVAKRFNVGMFPKGETRSVTFDQAGLVDVRCNVHPKMQAYVMVLKSPSFTVPATDGTYSISGIPAGRYQLHAWHPSLKPIEKWINVSSGEVLQVNLQLEK